MPPDPAAPTRGYSIGPRRCARSALPAAVSAGGSRHILSPLRNTSIPIFSRLASKLDWLRCCGRSCLSLLGTVALRAARNALSSSPVSWNASSVLRCICRPRCFCALSLRALWLAATLLFAWRSHQAETLMPSILDGKAHSVGDYLTISDEAVRLYPFDQHLRDSRIFIRKQIEQQLQQAKAGTDAAREPSAAPSDVRGGQ